MRPRRSTRPAPLHAATHAVGTIRRRHGFMLPLVVVVTLLVALLTAGAQSAAWRATRAARQAWNGERALLAADEGIGRLQSTWDPQAFAEQSIGNRAAVQRTTADGAVVDLQMVRTQPLVAWIEANARSSTAGAPRPAQRRIARALHLQPPALPFGAALVALSPIRLHAGAVVSGIDDVVIPDPCGPWRDSTSIAGIHAQAPVIDAAALVLGAPATSAPADPPRDTRLWNNAWPYLQSRSAPRALPAGTGTAVLATSWRAVIVRDSVPLTIAGTVSHEGLLVVDGDLVITGSLRLHGMLLVNGTVDTRTGALELRGALIVRSPAAQLSHFGSRTTVRYSQCAMQRAVSAVAMPATMPFALWSER